MMTQEETSRYLAALEKLAEAQITLALAAVEANKIAQRANAIAATATRKSY